MGGEVIGELLDGEVEADELAFRYLREVVEDHPGLAAVFAPESGGGDA